MNRSEARSIVYGTLSGCYSPPDETHYLWIVEGSWIGPLQKAFGLLTEGGGDLLPNWAAFVPGKEERRAGEMMCDYRRLFTGSLHGAFAPCCGDQYQDGRGFQEAPSPGIIPRKVFRGYRLSGHPLQKDFRGVPDHIVNGFEFMGTLADRAARLAGAEKIRLEEMQMNFFSRFLLPWVPWFCGRIVEGAHLPFYRCLGVLTGQFVDFEKNYLGVTEEGDAG